MALVKDPIGRAHRVTTQLQAARLHDELEVELGMNPDVDGTDWERQAEEAVRFLNERWPGLDDVDRGGPRGTEWAPRPSRGAARWMHETSPEQHASRRRASSGSRARSSSGSRRPPSGGRRRSSPIPSSGGQVADALGVTAAAGTATDAVFGAIRIGLGLALVYLLLSPRGSRAFSTILGAVSGGFRAFVAPVDPFNPTAASPQPTKRATRAAAGRTANQLVRAGAPLVTGPRGATTRRTP